MTCFAECNEEDYAIVPNIPMFGAFQKLAKESPVVKSMFIKLLVSLETLPKTIKIAENQKSSL